MDRNGNVQIAINLDIKYGNARNRGVCQGRNVMAAKNSGMWCQSAQIVFVLSVLRLPPLSLELKHSLRHEDRNAMAWDMI